MTDEEKKAAAGAALRACARRMKELDLDGATRDRAAMNFLAGVDAALGTTFLLDCSGYTDVLEALADYT